MAINLEDAGFEIRDIVAWIYGSGFPKSLNIGKAVDSLNGHQRELIAVKQKKAGDFRGGNFGKGGYYKKIDIPITKGSSEWEGWGTALKPAMELWTLIRKPISEKTIAENVMQWGTGGINIDDCRVCREGDNKLGRYPANIIHNGSEEVLELFPEYAGALIVAEIEKLQRLG